VLEKERKFEEAITPLQRAVELDPSYPEPHYTLGRIYQRQGKRQEAQEEIEKFKKLRKEPSPLANPALDQAIPPKGVALQNRPIP
jgi:Flp pilus assembly protein TadD